MVLLWFKGRHLGVDLVSVFSSFPRVLLLSTLRSTGWKKKVFRRYLSLPRYAFSKLCKFFFPARGTVFPNICPDNKTIRKSNTDFMRPERSRLISNRKEAKGTKHPPRVLSPRSLEFLYHKTLETSCVPVHETLI